MIFADKLIQLRKKNGWSQEELAEQMNVTRQSVSKWEGAQSIPDLDKVIKLSELFGVSIDYLLKDEIEELEPGSFTEDGSGKEAAVKRVSMEEANAFLTVKKATARPIAYATLLCILSPICLFILGAVSEMPGSNMTEGMAGGLGMIVLLLMVAAAVAVFVFCGSKTAPFAYLEEECFETEYGVTGMVKERREQYKSTYTRNNMIGVCMCILSLIPLFAGVAINEKDELLLVLGLSAMFVLIGIGVVYFISGGIVWASFDRLLQEGDYTKEKKERSSVTMAISTAYWMIATAIFLAYSFITNDWEHSWIVWPVAGVLFPAVITVSNIWNRRK
ncbi:MAG: helix-turn-helix domain-containing protein [Lachnospiraceae bacterium]|nr:helix-turn-helix domain-containing protein [Lachnospiraceae bacterium]